MECRRRRQEGRLLVVFSLSTDRPNSYAWFIWRPCRRCACRHCGIDRTGKAKPKERGSNILLELSLRVREYVERKHRDVTSTIGRRRDARVNGRRVKRDSVK